MENNKEIILYIHKIPRSILNKFYISVIFKTNEKFGSFFTKNYVYRPNQNVKYSGIISARITIGIIYTILNAFFGGLLLVLLILGLVKISKEKSDIKYFLKKFILRYFLVSIAFLLITISIFVISQLSAKKINYDFAVVLILILLIIYLYIFYQYSKVLYDYLCWLFESKEASENRRQWLGFKSFVIKNSEIEKAPLSHYILWGPFYYYTLAVGGMKNLNIR